MSERKTDGGWGTDGGGKAVETERYSERGIERDRQRDRVKRYRNRDREIQIYREKER